MKHTNLDDELISASMDGKTQKSNATELMHNGSRIVGRDRYKKCQTGIVPVYNKSPQTIAGLRALH
jgi:hypothetical protein